VNALPRCSVHRTRPNVRRGRQAARGSGWWQVGDGMLLGLSPRSDTVGRGAQTSACGGGVPLADLRSAKTTSLVGGPSGG